MTLSERAKFAAAKRHIKTEYAEMAALAKETEGSAPQTNFYRGALAAYVECFRVVFYNDSAMTDEMLKQLINLKDNE